MNPNSPRAAAAPYQLKLTSGISETVRMEIARKKEVAMTLAIQKKKDREEGEHLR